MTPAMLAALNTAANPECLDCNGDGFIPICWNNDPDRCEDVVCDCVSLDADGQPLSYEPPEPPDPDGEDFRGDEAAGYLAEQQAAAQRLK